MNGRIYDPVLGRMLSADTLVQLPGNLQSYNRYSYVQNNPLTFRDPSGHVLETVWDVANIGIGVASLVSNIKGGNVGAAILDSVGIIADTAAAAVPFIPGGAGTAIKVARATAKVAGNLEKAGNAIVGGDKVVTDVKDGKVGLDTLGAAANLGAAAKAKSGANKADGGANPAVAKMDGGDIKAGEGSTLPKKADTHHIQTDKNSISTAAGGPYTPKFEALAERRGVSLQDSVNKMELPGHKGPHPEYNKVVYDRMEKATGDLKGNEFNKAYDAALEKIRKETAEVGSELNDLATGKRRK